MPLAKLLASAAVTTLLLTSCGQATETTPEPAASSAPVASEAPASAAESPVDAAPTPESTDGENADTDGEAKPAKTYLTLEECEASEKCKNSERVLFFHATWCPSCKATEESLNKEAPEGFTVVKVDFDSETDLRKKYGITQQHTFVSVNEAGEKQKVWSGSVTADDIKSQI